MLVEAVAGVSLGSFPRTYLRPFLTSMLRPFSYEDFLIEDFLFRGSPRLSASVATCWAALTVVQIMRGVTNAASEGFGLEGTSRQQKASPYIPYEI